MIIMNTCWQGWVCWDLWWQLAEAEQPKQPKSSLKVAIMNMIATIKWWWIWYIQDIDNYEGYGYDYLIFYDIHSKIGGDCFLKIINMFRILWENCSLQNFEQWLNMAGSLEKTWQFCLKTTNLTNSQPKIWQKIQNK